jgi:hypothetical protein
MWEWIIDRFLSKKIKTIFQLKNHYHKVFDLKNESAKIVMADLRQFCDPDLFKGMRIPADPVELGRRVGKEEVFKRICFMLNINEIDIDNSIIREEKTNEATY